MSRTPPYRILHVVSGLDVGGAERMLVSLLRRRDADASDVRVLCLKSPGRCAKDIVDTGVPVASLGLGGIRIPVGDIFNAVRDAARFRPDVIHGWMYHGCLAAWLLRTRVPGARLVWSMHNANVERHILRPSTHRIVRTLARYSASADAIVYCAESAQVAHETIGYRRDRSVLIRNGIDVERYRGNAEQSQAIRSALGIPADAPVIGTVSRDDVQKDIGNFMTAAERLHRDRPDVHFVLCGAGLERSAPAFRRWLANPAFASKLHLLGVRDDIPSVLSSFDIFTLSSASEAFPLALCEAMASGRVCVATDVGDTAWMLGETGLLVPPRDAGALADAWQRTLAMPDGERETIGRSAAHRARAQLSIDQCVNGYHALYAQTIAPPHELSARGHEA